MLSIYCGDNNIASRQAFSEIKSQFRKQGRLIYDIEASMIDDIVKSGGSDATDLFAGDPIYETSNLIISLKIKYQRKAKEYLRNLFANTSIQLIDWEQKSTYDLGIDKDKFDNVYEYRLADSTFSLIPSLIPGQKSIFLRKLQSLGKSQAIELTFAMILRHFKLMLVLAEGLNPKDSPALVWMARTSLPMWPKDKLLKFYNRLLLIDINVKTGRNTPLNLSEQLEILVSIAL